MHACMLAWREDQLALVQAVLRQQARDEVPLGNVHLQGRRRGGHPSTAASEFQTRQVMALRLAVQHTGRDCMHMQTVPGM